MDTTLQHDTTDVVQQIRQLRTENEMLRLENRYLKAQINKVKREAGVIADAHFPMSHKSPEVLSLDILLTTK
jgi:regulator of replication initiation timing